MFVLRRPVRLVRTLSTLNRPAPPPLPPKQQREFEELVRAASAPASSKNSSVSAEVADLQARIARGEGLHPDARQPPPPEFDGDTNPATGEVGGPKREPLRHGDWSYGGRITDF